MSTSSNIHETLPSAKYKSQCLDNMWIISLVVCRVKAGARSHCEQQNADEGKLEFHRDQRGQMNKNSFDLQTRPFISRAHHDTRDCHISDRDNVERSSRARAHRCGGRADALHERRRRGARASGSRRSNVRGDTTRGRSKQSSGE